MWRRGKVWYHASARRALPPYYLADRVGGLDDVVKRHEEIAPEAPHLKDRDRFHALLNDESRL
jgi:hypothetical protein